jgi:tripartite-type tricarboxylate transporter receptor subunit TctC
MTLFVRLARALAATAFLVAACGVHAQSWPTKPVRMYVPLPPGTAPDIVARLVADKLGGLWGQPVVVENRPGAGGIPTMSALSRAAPDGYTIALVPASVVTLTPLLFRDPQFNADKDIMPLAAAGLSPMMIVVNPASGIQTLPDLIRTVKASPGKVNFASPGANTVPFLTGDMLNRAADMQLYSVPYNGSVASVTAAMTGEAVVAIDGLPPLVPHVKSGKLRAIAVTSAQRLPGYENIPTAAETVPGFESIGWFAIFSPAGLPAPVVERINADMNRVMAMPDIVARLAELGVYPNPGPQKQVEQFYAQQRALWRKVVTDVGLQPQ